MASLITDQFRLNIERQRVSQEIQKIERQIRASGSIWPFRWALRRANKELRDVESVQQLVHRALSVERI